MANYWLLVVFHKNRLKVVEDWEFESELGLTSFFSTDMCKLRSWKLDERLLRRRGRNHDPEILS